MALVELLFSWNSVSHWYLVEKIIQFFLASILFMFFKRQTWILQWIIMSSFSWVSSNQNLHLSSATFVPFSLAILAVWPLLVISYVFSMPPTPSSGFIFFSHPLPSTFSSSPKLIFASIIQLSFFFTPILAADLVCFFLRVPFLSMKLEFPALLLVSEFLQEWYKNSSGLTFKLIFLALLTKAPTNLVLFHTPKVCFLRFRLTIFY